MARIRAIIGRKVICGAIVRAMGIIVAQSAASGRVSTMSKRGAILMLSIGDLRHAVGLVLWIEEG